VTTATATFPLTIQDAKAFDARNPKPGIYRDVPSEVYFSARAVNHSTLKLMDRSPAHFKVNYASGSHKESDAKRLGSLAHLMLFEPSRVKGNTIPAPINPKTSRAYGMDTKAWQEYADANPGKLIVSDEEMDRATRMVASVLEHPQLGVIFNASTESEVVIVWDDGGVVCKAKLDAIVGTLMIGDLKTTADASERAFAGSIVEYGYDTQAAFYLRGCHALGLSGLDFVFGCVENEAPYEAAGYTLGAEFLSIGRVRVDRWLDQVRKCQQANAWPGYTGELVEIQPPTWYIAKFADGNV